MCARTRVIISNTCLYYIFFKISMYSLALIGEWEFDALINSGV